MRASAGMGASTLGVTFDMETVDRHYENLKQAYLDEPVALAMLDAARKKLKDEFDEA
jgi:tRNA G10  N-methylase Trm11